MSKHHIISRLIAFMAFMAILTPSMAQDQPLMTVKAKSDSTTLVMGDRTTVNVEVVKNSHEGALIGMPQVGKDYYGMELIDVTADSTDLGNGRIELKYHFTFQAFDPNDLLTLPGFRYAVAGDTVASEVMTFKVLPVDLSPELGDVNVPDSLRIHPDELTLQLKSRWYDYIPNWTLWALLIAALIAIAIVLAMLYKKNGAKLFVPRKPIPPYDLAMQSLRRLKAKDLIGKGMAKQFFTEVTDIWRKYLEGRFGISAMEMTSKQILKQLRKNKETRLSSAEIEQMLEISDFVKFAAMTSTPDEMVKTYDTIYRFIEATRPVEEPEETPGQKPTDNNDNKDNKDK